MTDRFAGSLGEYAWNNRMYEACESCTDQPEADANGAYPVRGPGHTK
jgi:hypothetical protein